MKLIVGLGNPGAAYRNTRHNLGFEVLDRLAADLGVCFDREKYQGLIAETSAGGGKLLLLKPMTYMNRSGNSVALAARNRVNDPGEILIVYDDTALPLGRLRLRQTGSAGTHNGMKSVLERLGTKDVPRIRLGVGSPPSGIPLSDYVLGKFKPEERNAVSSMLDNARDALRMILREGFETAMNTYNRPEQNQ